MKTRLMILAASLSALTLSCIKVNVNQPTSQPINSAVVGESIDTNSYSLGVSQMNNVTDSRSATVHYNLPSMDVSVGGMLNSGSISLQITQSNNTVIYSETFTNVLGHNQAITISPDDYLIELDFNNVSGELGLSIDGDI